MSFNAKLFLALLVIEVFVACENKKPQKYQPQNVEVAQVDSQPTEEETVEPVYKIYKSSCGTQEIVQAAYKSESTNGFSLRVTPICLNDYGVIDTAFGNGDTTPVMVSSNYKYRVQLFLPNDSVTYYISKEDIPAESSLYGYVLVDPEIKSYKQDDTTVYLDFELGWPDTDNVLICKFKLGYNRGVEYVGYEEPEFDSLIYD
jgi:hypothetical protein